MESFMSLRSVQPFTPSIHTLLTVHPQTELALHTIVAMTNIREDVATTRELVSDMHRTMLNDKEGAGCRNQTVGVHSVLFTIERFLQLPRLEPGLQFQL